MTTRVPPISSPPSECDSQSELLTLRSSSGAVTLALCWEGDVAKQAPVTLQTATDNQPRRPWLGQDGLLAEEVVALGSGVVVGRIGRLWIVEW